MNSRTIIRNINNAAQAYFYVYAGYTEVTRIGTSAMGSGSKERNICGNGVRHRVCTMERNAEDVG
ncbi:hypothetical protein J2T13_000132 [Paenibacillus sp. DS2015]|uniref:hypothetical protein n=1 Tax=Paenibacillus sp. DS2015 TaxID=3373917 RepID=UPI003D1AFFDA